MCLECCLARDSLYGTKRCPWLGRLRTVSTLDYNKQYFLPKMNIFSAVITVSVSPMTTSPIPPMLYLWTCRRETAPLGKRKAASSWSAITHRNRAVNQPPARKKKPKNSLPSDRYRKGQRHSLAWQIWKPYWLSEMLCNLVVPHTIWQAWIKYAHNIAWR